MLSALVCLGRHTVTGLLHTAGESFQDWSAVYRLFSQARVEAQDLFGVLRRGVVEQLAAGAPLVVALDDSLLPKRGTKIPGVAWRRDPLGPPFQTNLIRAQRVLQISAAVAGGADPQAARLIPLDFQHAPSPPKPGRHASAQQQQHYRRECRRTSLAQRGVERLQALRQKLDQHGPPRQLEVLVDGRFTNRTVLRNLPSQTVLLGRLRQDAKLYYLPAGPGAATGRRRRYGERAPTPEQLREDKNVPWKTVSVYATGRRHRFRVKSLAPLRWRPAGGDRDLRLLVIAPLRYRLRRGSRLLYRQPAYLLATDVDLSLQQIVQHYVWRWDIEVNFRDEKTLLGVGEAQVRHARSVEAVPQLLVAAYAWLLLAARQTWGPAGFPDALPPPKWRAGRAKPRATTLDLIQHLRAELWGEGLRRFCGFPSTPAPIRKPQKLRNALPTALLYASP